MNEKFLKPMSFASQDPGQPTPPDAYRQLIDIANKQHKKIFLDCSGTQLALALNSSFFGLHVNQEEAFQICGSTDFEVLLQRLENRVELVAMTQGKDGLLMAYQGKVLSSNVAINRVVSTVGSGDCLTAGLALAVEKAQLRKKQRHME